MLRLSIVFIAILLTNTLEAQDLVTGSRNSPYTYIYQLTDDQALKIIRNGLGRIDDEDLFRQKRDSFSTGTTYMKDIAPGNYLNVFVKENKLDIEYISVPNVQVSVIENQTDLVVQVRDLKGSLIKDASVTISGKGIPYDEKTAAYRLKKANCRGVLTVDHEGLKNFMELNRQYNNPAIKRFGKKVAYETPVKYVWIPVRLAVSLPINTIASVIRGYGYGAARQIWYYISSPFRTDWSFNPGYVVFSKPRYMPGDTLRVKAFITHGDRHKPVDCETDVKLSMPYPEKDIRLGSVIPHAPGAYSFECVLADSLNLTLDKRYQVAFYRKNSWKELISGSFQYEFYELRSSKLALRVPEKNQYRGKPFIVALKATNENGMVLPDARAKIFIVRRNVPETYGRQTLIKDTLATINEYLKPSGETLVEIPDSIFPEATIAYTLIARINTSDNETVTEKSEVTFFDRREKIDYEISCDTLEISYSVNGMEQSSGGWYYCSDSFGNATDSTAIAFPFKLKIDPFFSAYTLAAGRTRETIDMSALDDGLRCTTERKGDSVFIDASTSNGLMFCYFIYEVNRERKRGYASELHYAAKATDSRNWYISLSYLWGGKMKNKLYEIVPEKDRLNITIDQPAIILPGQKATIKLHVTDYKGGAVSGLDLTAFSMTGKFGYELPALPQLAKLGRRKELVNRFTGSWPGEKDLYHPFRYDFWDKEAGLDTLEYFKFRYHKDDIYVNHSDMMDSITQFAPFIFKNGRTIPVSMISVDRRPVYIDVASSFQPYSFRIDSGYHFISVRTPDFTYEADSIRFAHGKKLILSINDTTSPSHYSRKKAKPVLGKTEIGYLNNFIMSYRPKFDNGVAFIEQSDRVFLLSNTSAQLSDPARTAYSYGWRLTGPVMPARAEFNSLGAYTTKFEFEPGFEYDFAPGLLKMRSFIPHERIPSRLSRYPAEHDPSEKVLTKGQITETADRIRKARALSSLTYSYGERKNPGNGSVSIEKMPSNEDKKPVVLILYSPYTHRLYNQVGANTLFPNVQPGSYELVAFYENDRYITVDSILVRPDCLTVISAADAAVKTGEEMFSRVISLVNSPRSYDTRLLSADEKIMLQKLNASEVRQYDGVGYTVTGTVISSDDRLPIPGVSIVIEGTSSGTVTDINGNYSIHVPVGGQRLSFRFIGMKSVEEDVANGKTLDVVLESDVMALDEVIVVGYGVAKSLSLAGSVAQVSSSLQGKAAGATVTGAGGPSITIRGISTTGAERPLIIIDGAPFMGDISDLDPDMIAGINVVNDTSLTSIYGSRAANGVIMITTRPGAAVLSAADKGVTFDEAFMDLAMETGTLRKNFRDDAFWKPHLTTDDSGRVSFTAVFPDDITSWETFVIGMNGNRQAGSAKGTIKSFRPVVAQLAAPRYLTEGDSVNLIGKIVNYTVMPQTATETFICNGDTLVSRERSFADAVIDTLPVTARQHDSLRLEFSFITTDGLKDGEYRPLPVNRAGLETDSGSFVIIERDSSVSIDLTRFSGKVTVAALSNARDLIRSNATRLIHYSYECNEQMASKLIALLASAAVDEATGRAKQKNEREIKRIIRNLADNQNSEGLWGWWGRSSTDGWITTHVIEALMKARKEGYLVQTDEAGLTDNAVVMLESGIAGRSKLTLLEALSAIKAKVDYPRYLSMIDTTSGLNFRDSLRITLLKQRHNLPADLLYIEKARQRTIYGNIYFRSDKEQFSVADNDISNTLLAFEILKGDSTYSANNLKKIRNYLLECLTFGNNLNTYQAAGIIGSLYGNYDDPEEAVSGTVINLSGAMTATIDTFPFVKTFEPEGALTIEKKGMMPLFLSMSQRQFLTNPAADTSEFIISTRFSVDDDRIRAGEPVKLIADAEIKNKADYLIIEIPVPSGFSYDDKKNRYQGEDHREFYRDHVAIFMTHVKPGRKKFEIDLVPRFSGKFVLNPARVSLMYFPTISSNDRLKEVYIK